MKENEQIKIKIEPLGKELTVLKGTPLKDIIFEYGIEFPCGGKGHCGGCKIKPLSGDVKDPEKHKEIVYKLGLGLEYRLACISEVVEDMTIEIPQLDTLILVDDSYFSFRPREGYGIAIDVGTTTIVAQLVDMKSSKVISAQTCRNPQSQYGADIMNRILYALTTEGRKNLKELIRNEIFRLIKMLLHKKSIDLKKIVLVGNTVMHHLFCDFDVQPLSMYPFETVNNISVIFSAEDLHWDLPETVQIVFIRPIAGFVGSDVYAGIIAAEMNTNPHLSALIDLGTNGEMVVGNKDGMVCASTAAGPAFEGANIHMGMSARSGAISSVSLSAEKIKYHVIGNYEPLGICGSGLIDAVAVSLTNKSIDVGGAFANHLERLKIGGKVYLTQKDVREFQLAKGALAAGLQILVRKLGKSLDDIRRLFISGAFGHFINLENAVRLGMIEVDEYKIKKLGNSALIGAKMLLFSDDYSLDEVIPKIEHISLDADSDFQDIFVEKMIFENYN